MANQIVASVYQIDGNPQGRGEPQDNFLYCTFPTSQILMFEATLSTISYVNTAIQFYNNPLQPNQYQTFYVSETLTELVAAANIGGTTQVEIGVFDIDTNPIQVTNIAITYSFPAIGFGQISLADGVTNLLYFKGKIYRIDTGGYDLAAAANSGDYKVYTALLSQTGTDAPVATVLQNTLGGTVVWTREDVGSYKGTLAGAFLDGKTYATLAPLYNGNESGFTVSLVRNSDDDVIFYTVSSLAAQTDGMLLATGIEIRVFP